MFPPLTTNENTYKPPETKSNIGDKMSNEHVYVEMLKEILSVLIKYESKLKYMKEYTWFYWYLRNSIESSLKSLQS